MNKAISLTENQLQKMTHAIGFSARRVKKGQYEAYRNYYDAGGADKDWEHLVSVGYAIRRHSQITDDIYYSVTRKGLDCLERIMGVRISESD